MWIQMKMSLRTHLLMHAWCFEFMSNALFGSNIMSIVAITERHVLELLDEVIVSSISMW